MRTAREELAEIESTTNWPALIEMALADPPKPQELHFHLQRWAIVFSVVYVGYPLEADFPEPMQAFFRRLKLAAIAPDLIGWLDSFKARRGREARKEEIPPRLRGLLPSNAKRGGRPRLDTKRWRDARAAWVAEAYSKSYEERRDGIQLAKEAGCFSSCFGFSPENIDGDCPSSLALEIIAGEAGLSPSRLADYMGHRKRIK